MSSRIVGMKTVTVTVSTAGTAQRIMTTTNAERYVTDFEVYVPIGNTGTNIYIGDSTVDNTWIPRAKGVRYNFYHGTGTLLGPGEVTCFDLSKIYIDVDTNGDQAIIQYFSRVLDT